ncbi:MAG: hypothetical protein IJ658_14085 [Kiritimatiellae bacterium]|nr:hypothetical protein [Kiritimatiellia bacterium]
MYAHLITPSTISTNPPRSAIIDGAQVVGELPESYLNSQRWYRLETTPAPETQDGYHAEARYAYDSDETPTRIVQSWEVVQDAPPPPRTISKFKLKLEIARRGLLPAFEQLLAGFEVAPGYPATDAFSDAVTLDEDNADFEQAVEAVKKTLGITAEQVEEILSASVAD